MEMVFLRVDLCWVAAAVLDWVRLTGRCCCAPQTQLAGYSGLATQGDFRWRRGRYGDSHGMSISGDSNSNTRRLGRTENAFCTFGMDSETRLRFC
jgi:hypothetical protein